MTNETLKPIDVTVAVNNGMDCEFKSEDDQWYLADLDTIQNMAVKGYDFRPRLNHWFVWRGGECLLPEGLVVEVVLRDGTKIKSTANHFDWGQFNCVDGRDIIAFQIIGPADGWCWPWEDQPDPLKEQLEESEITPTPNATDVSNNIAKKLTKLTSAVHRLADILEKSELRKEKGE